MFDPEWTEGCKSCSFIADHCNPAIIHLYHRDVTMVTVSRAPLPKLEAFRKRMGWSFKWVSSYVTDFNWDYHVSFDRQAVANTGLLQLSHSIISRDRGARNQRLLQR